MLLEGDPLYGKWYSALFNLCYNCSKTLGTWELEEAAQLDKHSGKAGTLGIKLIMMLDPLGKAYYYIIHRRASDKKTHFGYEFYPKRRQMGATGKEGKRRGRWGGQWTLERHF